MQAAQACGSCTWSGLARGPAQTVCRAEDHLARKGNGEQGRCAPLPRSPGAPRLFVLSQQLSIEMNGISRGFTSDKCSSAAAARILMCAL